MEKAISIALIMLFMAAFIGCGDTKVIDGIEYDIYGVANSEEKKNTDIEYRIITGNVFWSCILIGTIIAPIYFICFSLYEPVGIKDHSKPKGAL